MPKPQDIQAWSIEGRFQHLIYSPRGAIEGLLIDTDGAVTQFVTDPQDAGSLDSLVALEAGQAVVVEGIEEPPSPKGESAHMVYRFQRLASVDGKEVGASKEPAEASGKVARFNYARHGEPNGFVLDSGDFVHTKPDGFRALGLKVGDQVSAQGPSRPLLHGKGRVVEAQSVNGTAVGR